MGDSPRGAARALFPPACSAAALVPRGHVLSFYAPYRCDACKTTFQALIDAYVHRDAIMRKVAPKVPCPKCGKEASYDGEASAFAAAAAQVEPPPVSAMREFDPTTGGRLDRSTRDGVTHFVLVGELTASARWRSAFDGVAGTIELDLSRATGIASGGVSPLISALRNATAKAIVLRGAPRGVAESVRAGPMPILTLASVCVDGTCKKCGVPRRALMEVVEGNYETTLVRAVVCPHCKGPLQVGRADDLPQRTIPFGFMLGLSGVLAVVGFVVVVAGIVLAGIGGPPAPDAAMPKAVGVEDRLDIGETMASALGTAGPYPTATEAEFAARDKALSALVSALARDIAKRRGLEGAVDVPAADAKRFAEFVSPDLAQLQISSEMTQGAEGYTVTARYGLSRVRYDAFAAEFSDERKWGGLRLVKPFPPVVGIRVVDSEVPGLEPGLRLVRIGPDAAAMESLPPPTPGTVLVVQDPDGTESTFTLP